MTEERKTEVPKVRLLGVKPVASPLETVAPSPSITENVALTQTETAAANDPPSRPAPAPTATAAPAENVAPAKLQARSQRYAAEVYGKVSAVKTATRKGDAFRKKYGGMAHKLPILIRTAGLAQALSFVESKAKTGEPDEQKKKVEAQALTALLKDIGGVVLQDNMQTLAETSRDKDTDLFAYMHLTRRTLDALVWFKRFAVSVLDVKQGDDEAGDSDAEEASTSSAVEEKTEV